MERQLLIAQLAVLLEQGAAQHRLRRQAQPPGLPHPISAQVRRDQAGQLAVLIEPGGHRLQLATDLVPGEQIEYAGLDRAFLAHRRLRWLRVVLWNQWLDAKVYPKPPETASEKMQISTIISVCYPLWTGTS
jgi:hypothetical protein